METGRALECRKCNRPLRLHVISRLGRGLEDEAIVKAKYWYHIVGPLYIQQSYGHRICTLRKIRINFVIHLLAYTYMGKLIAQQVDERAQVSCHSPQAPYSASLLR